MIIAFGPLTFQSKGAFLKVGGEPFFNTTLNLIQIGIVVHDY